jgi:hypothetical protein
MESPNNCLLGNCKHFKENRLENTSIINSNEFLCHSTGYSLYGWCSTTRNHKSNLVCGKGNGGGGRGVVSTFFSNFVCQFFLLNIGRIPVTECRLCYADFFCISSVIFEAKFLDEIGTKFLQVFLLVFHRHLY